MSACESDPPIEKMVDDLIGGGWNPQHNGTVWESLWGLRLRGPHKAWHYWHGGASEVVNVFERERGGDK